MIKVSRKINRTIEREFGTSDYTIIKRVYIHSIYAQLCVNLIVFRIGKSHSVRILRYHGDDSYSILGLYQDETEVIEELQFQLNLLY